MHIVGLLGSNIKEWYSEENVELKEYRYNFFLKRWIELIILDIDNFDIKNKVFTEYKSQTASYGTTKRNILPKLIWIRTSEERLWYLTLLWTWVNLIPSQLIIVLACDKRHTYRYLQEYQPKTCLLSKVSDDLLNQMTWVEVIVKPRKWSWWEWVLKLGKLRSEY